MKRPVAAKPIRLRQVTLTRTLHNMPKARAVKVW